MKDIEQFLRDNKPETPDEGQFMIEMNARLNQVEGIKKTVDGENRRWRVALIIASAAGLVVGCLVTLLVMLYPVQSINIEGSAFARTVEALQGHKEILFGIIALCSAALGILLMTRKREAF